MVTVLEAGVLDLVEQNLLYLLKVVMSARRTVEPGMKARTRDPQRSVVVGSLA